MTIAVLRQATAPARAQRQPSAPPAPRPPAPLWPDAASPLDRLAGFAPISLAEMDAVALLNRTDSKFVFAAARLAEILPALCADYRVLEIAGRRAHRYHTAYFDTAYFALYRRHHAGGRNRYKVRLRTYLESGQAFAEVKHKISADRTIKRRLAVAPAGDELPPECAAWLAALTPLDPAALAPVLWNDFTRITLVSLAAGERVTLDLDLRFGRAGRLADLPALAVAEVKQAGVNRSSPFMQAIRRLGEHQTGLSKYCTGAALLYDHLPQNNLKPTLRRIRAIHEDPCND
jgi:hypothetical protein